MKFLNLMVLMLPMSFAQAEDLIIKGSCKRGDIEDCVRYLKSKNHLARSGRESDFSEFRQEFTDVCNDNPTFKCKKIIVRGDIQSEIIELTKEYETQVNKPIFFQVKQDKEEMLFMMQKISQPQSQPQSQSQSQFRSRVQDSSLSQVPSQPLSDDQSQTASSSQSQRLSPSQNRKNKEKNINPSPKAIKKPDWKLDDEN